MRLAAIDDYDPGRVDRQGQHAVVLGAGIAGLLAARVLADAFEQVTILDRDSFEDGTGARRGVPQSQHPHVLLIAGQRIMEDLAPGFADDLVTSGALVLDMNRELDVHAAGGFLAPGESEIPMHFASRPLVERSLRTRIADHSRVRLRPDCQVTDHLADDGGELRGVVVARDGEQHEMGAELVVDATGRTSRTRAWLEQLGHPAPPSDTVHIDLAYRTCQLRRPSDDRRATMVMPDPPRTRGAAVIPVEDDRWYVTLFGLHGDHAPGDLDGMRDFADALPAPMVREVLDEHDLATPDIAHYRFPANTRHRFEQLEDHPKGLLSLGDAVASFNPIYGQGMSVAAMEALALHDALADEGVQRLASGFYDRLDDVVGDAWDMAAGGDFQFSRTRGPRPRGATVTNRYVSRLHRRAHTDGWLAEQFKRVVAMDRPPTSLFRPSVVWRVLGPGGR